jgi:hypothetical protein
MCFGVVINHQWQQPIIERKFNDPMIFTPTLAIAGAQTA